MEDLIINDQIVIPAEELEFTFARSGGPGGQNVNKVNSKATMYWDYQRTSAPLYPVTLARLKALAANRITDKGLLQITSQVHRDQPQNIQACKDRLRALILEAMNPPKPRRPTQPTRGSQRRRMEEKKQRGEKKQGRNARWD
ncbi:alternative ribosome rescue aminoacyl-tRNA hydrolase ArfB [Pirellulaceae bacterium SH449]